MIETRTRPPLPTLPEIGPPEILPSSRKRRSPARSTYEISERGTSWVGALTFGLIYQLTGSYRSAIFSLVTFFVIGFVLLARVDIRRAVREAGNEQPSLV